MVQAAKVALTLNILFPSNVALKASAHAFMHGEIYYNAMPHFPVGCTVKFSLKDHREKTYDKHSTGASTWAFCLSTPTAISFRM